MPSALPYSLPARGVRALWLVAAAVLAVHAWLLTEWTGIEGRRGVPAVATTAAPAVTVRQVALPDTATPQAMPTVAPAETARAVVTATAEPPPPGTSPARPADAGLVRVSLPATPSRTLRDAQARPQALLPQPTQTLAVVVEAAAEAAVTPQADAVALTAPQTATVAAPTTAAGEAQPASPSLPDPMPMAAAPARAGEAMPAAESPANRAPPPDPPQYATRLPAAQVLHYKVSKGALGGTGELSWQPEPGGYRLSLRAGMPLISVLIEQTSAGRIDARGLAPLRHTDRRWRRSERAISFERGADGVHGAIRYSIAESPRGLVAGTQDRLSWIVQLASIVRAWPGGVPRVGSEIEIWVAAVAGDLQHWVLQVAPTEAADAGLLHLVREPRKPHDTRAEVWLDARLQYLPRRLRLADSAGEPLELVSTDGQ